MKRPPSPTALTDAQWATLAPLLLDAPWWGRPRALDRRAIGTAMRSVSRHRIPWDALPHDLPNRSTVSASFRRWTDDGTWEAVTDALRALVRRDAGKDAEPGVGISDSPSVQVTAIPGERGSDAGTLLGGRNARSWSLRSGCCCGSWSIRPTARTWWAGRGRQRASRDSVAG